MSTKQILLIFQNILRAIIRGLIIFQNLGKLRLYKTMERSSDTYMFWGRLEISNNKNIKANSKITVIQMTNELSFPATRKISKTKITRYKRPTNFTTSRPESSVTGPAIKK